MKLFVKFMKQDKLVGLALARKTNLGYKFSQLRCLKGFSKEDIKNSTMINANTGEVLIEDVDNLIRIFSDGFLEVSGRIL